MAQVRMDTYGNKTILIGLKDKKGNGFNKGFIEIKGKLYKVEVNTAQSPKNEEITMWCKFTELAKRGGYNGNGFVGPYKRDGSF